MILSDLWTDVVRHVVNGPLGLETHEYFRKKLKKHLFLRHQPIDSRYLIQSFIHSDCRKTRFWWISTFPSRHFFLIKFISNINYTILCNNALRYLDIINN